ncbi:hypothetical protein AVEN_195284-1 [Araneus ventricosus]|uniref:Integrase p58-like C-terminal domain-containing protein n=1 Tax=Araneus ventricosus TaxID=182803 RepID=A0A4Y2FZ99_ARAVE|nr:hypothetical protein AVEN_195284-1 [Araneus ventricosus]
MEKSEAMEKSKFEATTKLEEPYTVVKKLNDVVYRVQKSPNGKPKVIDVNRLAPYRATDHCPMKEVLLEAKPMNPDLVNKKKLVKNLGIVILSLLGTEI